MKTSQVQNFLLWDIVLTNLLYNYILSIFLLYRLRGFEIKLLIMIFVTWIVRFYRAGLLNRATILRILLQPFAIVFLSGSRDCGPLHVFALCIVMLFAPVTFLRMWLYISWASFIKARRKRGEQQQQPYFFFLSHFLQTEFCESRKNHATFISRDEQGTARASLK